jgi:hypothetical protein
MCSWRGLLNKGCDCEATLEIQCMLLSKLSSNAPSAKTIYNHLLEPHPLLDGLLYRFLYRFRFSPRIISV